MSRFAQYHAKYKHDAGCYDWEQRQQHFGDLFDNDESIEFYMGEAEQGKCISTGCVTSVAHQALR